MNVLSDIARERGFEKGAAAELLLLHGKSRKRLNTEPQTADKTGGTASADRSTPCKLASADRAAALAASSRQPSS
jgi:hypothetical protein